MSVSSNNEKINFLVLKHLERYADKLPSLEKLKEEIEHQHLLGEFVDLDNQVQPLSYDEVNSRHRDISTNQLSSLVEEGVDYLKSIGNTPQECFDILKPIKTSNTLPVSLSRYYKSLSECLVDYCKLLGSEAQINAEIRNYEKNGDVEDEFTTYKKFDVPIIVPPGMGLGIILTHSSEGVVIKSFSSGLSLARDTGRINIGDVLTAINSVPVSSTLDAKNLITQTAHPILSFQRKCIV